MIFVRLHYGSPLTASDKSVTIGLDNGLSRFGRQAITWTNTGVLSIGPLGTNFIDTWINYNFFINENAFETVVWEMTDIF